MKRLVLVAALCLSANAAFGAVILTNNRASLGPGLSVDWGSLGPDLTDVVPPAAVGGVTVSGSPNFAVFAGSTYNADFLPDEMVLSNYDIVNNTPVSGVIRIVFNVAVAGAGAQVQALSFGNFAGTLEAFDAANASLGLFNVAGVNNGNGDGSAVFAGVVSDLANIKALEYSFGDGAAINHLSTQRGPDVVVPEPSTWMALATGLAAFVAARRRR